MNEKRFNLKYNKNSADKIYIWILIAIMIIFPTIYIFTVGLYGGIYLFVILYSFAILIVTMTRVFQQKGKKRNYIELHHEHILIKRRLPTRIKYMDIKSITLSGNLLVKIDIGAYFPLILMAKIENIHEFILEIAKAYQLCVGKNLLILRKDNAFSSHYAGI